jgi:hypothetical protein
MKPFSAKAEYSVRKEDGKDSRLKPTRTYQLSSATRMPSLSHTIAHRIKFIRSGTTGRVSPFSRSVPYAEMISCSPKVLSRL